MKDATIITDRREGRSIYYSVIDDRIFSCLETLEMVAEDAVKQLLEIS
jgi:DNA-binding transcriptional ArsR family regulator